jgi:Arc/MetJ family transcription regulator
MPKPLSDIDTASTIDRALLAEAVALLGAPSEAEAVNQALAAAIREHRRKTAVENEIRRLEAGAYAAGRAEGAR